MKNLYASLGTHILTDSTTLQKILDYKIGQNTLDEATIAQIRKYLLNQTNRLRYDQKLQQVYPQLLPQAQAIIEKSEQRKKLQNSVAPSITHTHTKKSAFPKILIGLILALVVISASYWGYQQWEKPYTKLIINTAHQTDLTPTFKQQLLNQTKNTNNLTDASFDESKELLVFHQNNKLLVLQNSNTPQDNKWQTALNNESTAKTLEGFYTNPSWLPNQPVLNFGWRAFAKLSPLGEISIEDNLNPLKVTKPSNGLSVTSSHAVSDDGKYSLWYDSMPNTDMMIINTHTQETFVRPYQNQCCLINWAKFSPDNKYLVTNLPSTNMPDVVDGLFSIKTDDKANVTDLVMISSINDIDRKISASNNSILIKTDNVFFYQNALATINNNGDLRYWDLATGKLLSEIKLNYLPIWEAQFSSDGRYLWYPTKTEVHAFDLKTGKDHYIAQNKVADGQNMPKPIIIGNKNIWLRNTTPSTSDVLTADF